MNRIFCFLFLIAYIIVSLPSSQMAFATIINIPDDYSTIQAGINASADGDTVLVQPNTYVENINFNGHYIVLGSLFLTTGDTSYISSTIIDGDSSGSVVIFNSGEDSTAVIIGFTIQNGLAVYGGGIYCDNNSSPTLSNNSITGNSTDINGRGGGIYCYESSPTISNNTISENSADLYGGGIYCYYSSPKIINNVITRNSANSEGGGIYCKFRSHPRIANTILWADNAPDYTEVYQDPTSLAVINYCDIQGGFEGVGNIDIDPLFRNPENGDFHLMATDCGDPYDSPCIDMGHPDILDNLLDCEWGLGTILSDMGAYSGGNYIPHTGRIINIPGDYSTIQAGINASSDGDTVLVQPGIYVENINFVGLNIVVGSLFLTTGDTSYISSTIIDGDSSGSVVVFETEEDSTTIVIGLTIQNGYTTYDYGGGIRCTDSSPTIDNNFIINNEVYYHGGGIGCINSSSKICSNIITGNLAGAFGGGIYCRESPPIIIDNVVSDNTASSDGGGIFCGESPESIINNNTVIDNHSGRWGGGIFCRRLSNSIVSQNTIVNNVGYAGGGLTCRRIQDYSLEVSYNFVSGNYANVGGGIFCSNSTIIINNNVIVSNSVNLDGGGLSCSTSHLILRNNTFYANMAPQYGGAIFRNRYTVIFDVCNNILWNDSAGTEGDEIYLELINNDSSGVSVTYCDIQGGWDDIGNISVDPLFRNPDNYDFHLMSVECGDPEDSPCIDAGDPTIFDSMLDCDWGLGAERSDMGAYGGGEGWVGIDEPIRIISKDFMLSQNYPNPFNATTTIQYSLHVASDVTIDIYDILGRKVETLVQAKQQAGHHQVVWNADRFASGMYFYKITAGDYAETRKMVLLK